MNNFLKLRGHLRISLCAVLFFPLLLFLMLCSILPQALVYVLFLCSVLSTLLSCTLLVSFFHPPAQASSFTPGIRAPSIPQSKSGLPTVPKSLQEVFALGDEKFEEFSAAVVIALGEGHRFRSLTKKSGDRGVDAILLNQYGQKVIVQSKLYRDASITGPDLRGFLGAIRQHDVVYGYFVTTSTFTAEALIVVRDTHHIRTIDGGKLDRLLKTRAREIALAWHDIQTALAEV